MTDEAELVWVGESCSPPFPAPGEYLAYIDSFIVGTRAQSLPFLMPRGRVDCGGSRATITGPSVLPLVRLVDFHGQMRENK